VTIGKRLLLAALAVAVCGLWPSAALAAPGDLDPSFGSGGKATLNPGGGEDGAGDVAIQPDGKIVVAGWDSDDDELVLARYLTNGTLDTSFGGGDGIASTDLLSYGAIALTPDGSIMVASGDGDFILARFTSAGALDTSFGGGDGIVQIGFSGNDYASDIIRQSDGKLLVSGEGGPAEDFALARFNADGTLDTSFGGGDGKVTTDFGSYDWTSGLALQQDGKIVAVGGTLFGGVPANESDFAVARYQPDGSLDTGFSGDGKATLGFDGFDSASSAAIQPNGKIVVGGTGVLAGKMHVTLVRYLANGTLDPGFGGGDGIVTNDLGPFGSNVSDLVLQPDGRIVTGGYGGEAAEDFLIVRHNPSGSLDTTFGGGDGWATADFTGPGNFDAASALALQQDGKIVAVGTAANRNTSPFDDELALARFEGGGAPPAEKEDPEPPNDPPNQSPGSGGSTTPPLAPTPSTGSTTPNTNSKKKAAQNAKKKKAVAKRKAQARKRALAKCRKLKAKAKRKRCVRRVNRVMRSRGRTVRRIA
jgi:uncharacterized delta-60 repeat protein